MSNLVHPEHSISCTVDLFHCQEVKVLPKEKFLTSFAIFFYHFRGKRYNNKTADTSTKLCILNQDQPIKTCNQETCMESKEMFLGS